MYLALSLLISLLTFQVLKLLVERYSAAGWLVGACATVSNEVIDKLIDAYFVATKVRLALENVSNPGLKL